MSVTTDVKLEVHEAVASYHGQTEDQSILASIGIDGQLFLIQFINFGIVFLIIWFLILKPLVRKMEERKKLVDESIDNAQAVKTSLAQSEAAFERKIQDAKAEANAIIAKASDDAERTAERIRIDTQQEIKEMVLLAKDTIAKEREEMVKGIKQEALTLVVDVSEKFLRRKITTDEDSEIISDILTEI